MPRQFARDEAEAHQRHANRDSRRHAATEAQDFAGERGEVALGGGQAAEDAVGGDERGNAGGEKQQQAQIVGRRAAGGVLPRGGRFAHEQGGGNADAHQRRHDEVGRAPGGVMVVLQGRAVVFGEQ